MALPQLSTVKSRFRVFLLMVLGAPMVFGALAFTFYLRDWFIQDAKNRLDETLFHQSTLAQEWLEDYAHNAAAFAAMDPVRRRDKADMEALFKAFIEAQPELFAIVYVNPEGVSEVAPGAVPGLNLADRAYFQAALEGEPYITQVLISRYTGDPVVIFSHPVVTPEGEFGGAVTIPVKLEAIHTVVQGLRSDGGGVFLVADDGMILTPTPGCGGEGLPAMATMPPHELTRLRAAIKQGESFRSLSGCEVLAEATRLSNVDWTMVAQTPVRRVLAGAALQALVFCGALVAAVLIVGPLAWRRLSITVLQPLQRLSQYADSVNAGERPAACPLTTKDIPREINSLFEAFCAMIARLDDHADKLRKLAITDQLTGLPNRVRLENEGSRIIEVCRRSGQPCAVIMLDLDRFKQINDRYGHAVGDKALRGVARVLRRVCRESDLPARYGGEEFCIIAANADSRQAMRLSERIRLAIEAELIPVDGVGPDGASIKEPLKLTASLGVSQCAAHPIYGATPLDDAIIKADKALYAAKDAGRNRTHAWSAMTPPAS